MITHTRTQNFGTKRTGHGNGRRRGGRGGKGKGRMYVSGEERRPESAIDGVEQILEDDEEEVTISVPVAMWVRLSVSCHSLPS